MIIPNIPHISIESVISLKPIVNHHTKKNGFNPVKKTPAIKFTFLSKKTYLLFKSIVVAEEDLYQIYYLLLSPLCNTR